MNAMLWWLLQTFAVTSVLIGLISLICRQLKNYPAVQHLLWLVVLIKFVTPTFFVWPWSVSEVSRPLAQWLPTNRLTSATFENWLRDVPLFSADEMKVEPRAGEVYLPFENVQVAKDQLEPAIDVLRSQSMPNSEVEINTVADRRRDVAFASSETIAVGLIAIWFGGCLFCSLRQLRSITKHWRVVRGGKPAPKVLVDEVAVVARQLGVRPLRMLVASNIQSPFVWCFGWLRLIWPAALLSSGDDGRLRGIAAHELAHIRRRDHWVVWLELLASIVWWWNPLFWFMRRELRESAELACDALALGNCPQNRRAYAELLLELSASSKIGAPATVLGVSTGAHYSLERRLSMILSDRVSGKTYGWGLFVAACLALAALPGWSIGQQQSGESSQPTTPDATAIAVDGEAQLNVDRRLVDLDATGEVAILVDENIQESSDEAIAIVRSLLPKSCVKGIPEKGTVSWKVCMNCHAAPGEATRAQNQLEKRPLTQTQKSNVPTLQFKGPSDYSRKLNEINPPLHVERGENLQFSLKRAESPLRVLKSREATYVLSTGKNGVVLDAVTDDGKQLWRSHVANDQANASQWWFHESPNKAHLNVLREHDDELSDFIFDRKTGKLIRHEVRRNATYSELPAVTRSERDESDSSRLERLEKAIQDLQLRLEKQNEPGVNTNPLSSGQNTTDANEDFTSLGIRYFDAIAETRIARHRFSQLNELPEVAPNSELVQARIVLENAEKKEQLLLGRLQEAFKTAQSAKEATANEFDRLQQLLSKGFIRPSELQAIQVRLVAQQARIKQLEMILAYSQPYRDDPEPIDPLSAKPKDSLPNLPLPETNAPAQRK